MEGRRRQLSAGLLVALLLVAGCASDKKAKSGITIDTLAAASGTACPVPLEVSADNSGVDTPAPATGSVVVGHPSTDPTLDATVGLADRRGRRRRGGVHHAARRREARWTSCSSRRGPTRRRSCSCPPRPRPAHLTADQSTQLGNDATRTKEGELIPVPGAEAMAMMRTKVNGATSAAFLVSSASLKRAQVEQIARQLDERLR